MSKTLSGIVDFNDGMGFDAQEGIVNCNQLFVNGANIITDISNCIVPSISYNPSTQTTTISNNTATTNLIFSGTLNTISTTVFNYLSGLTSNIQSQLNAITSILTGMSYTSSSQTTNLSGNLLVSGKSQLTGDTTINGNLTLGTANQLYLKGVSGIPILSQTALSYITDLSSSAQGQLNALTTSLGVTAGLGFAFTVAGTAYTWATMNAFFLEIFSDIVGLEIQMTTNTNNITGLQNVTANQGAVLGVSTTFTGLVKADSLEATGGITADNALTVGGGISQLGTYNLHVPHYYNNTFASPSTFNDNLTASLGLFTDSIETINGGETLTIGRTAQSDITRIYGSTCSLLGFPYTNINSVGAGSNTSIYGSSIHIGDSQGAGDTNNKIYIGSSTYNSGVIIDGSNCQVGSSNTTSSSMNAQTISLGTLQGNTNNTINLGANNYPYGTTLNLSGLTNNIGNSSSSITNVRAQSVNVGGTNCNQLNLTTNVSPNTNAITISSPNINMSGVTMTVQPTTFNVTSTNSNIKSTSTQYIDSPTLYIGTNSGLFNVIYIGSGVYGSTIYMNGIVNCGGNRIDQF